MNIIYRIPLYKIISKLTATIVVIFFLVVSTNVALATSHSDGMEQMTDEEMEQMTPSNQMSKPEAARDGQPKEIALDNGQQNLMLTAVAGIFIIIPVGIWIVSHQVKRSRKRQEEA